MTKAVLEWSNTDSWAIIIINITLPKIGCTIQSLHNFLCEVVCKMAYNTSQRWFKNIMTEKAFFTIADNDLKKLLLQ